VIRKCAAACLLIIALTTVSMAQDSTKLGDDVSVGTPAVTVDTVATTVNADSSSVAEKDQGTILSRLGLPLLVASMLGGALYLLFSRRGN